MFECVTMPIVVYSLNNPNLNQFYCCAGLARGDRANKIRSLYSCRTQTIGTDRQNKLNRYTKGGITNCDNNQGAEMEIMGYVGPSLVWVVREASQRSLSYVGEKEVGKQLGS